MVKKTRLKKIPSLSPSHRSVISYFARLSFLESTFAAFTAKFTDFQGAWVALRRFKVLCGIAESGRMGGRANSRRLTVSVLCEGRAVCKSEAFGGKQVVCKSRGCGGRQLCEVPVVRLVRRQPGGGWPCARGCVGTRASSWKSMVGASQAAKQQCVATLAATRLSINLFPTIGYILSYTLS